MKKVLIFSATWCGPCRQIHKVLDELIKEHPEWNIEYKDVDENEELCEKYSILNVPTFIFLNEEEGIYNKLSGINPSRNALESVIIDELSRI